MNRTVTGARLAAALIMAACCFLAVAAAGCGTDDNRSQLSPQELVVDTLLSGIVEGDSAAVLSALPPAWLDRLRADAGGSSDEELGTMIIDGLRSMFPFTDIVKVSYHVSERGDGTSDVYYWGEFAETDTAGGTSVARIDEAGARHFNLIESGGSWYLNVE